MRPGIKQMSNQVKEITKFPSLTINDAGELPYRWDGECHLIHNDFYFDQPVGLEEEFNEPLLFDFKIGKIPEITNNSTKENTMVCRKHDGVTNEKNLIYESTTGTVDNSISVQDETLKPSNKSIDSQLDFIIKSMKRPPKVPRRQRKTRRNMKTPAQLRELERAIKSIKHGNQIDKGEMRNLATKIGLSETKVYKWLWDKGYRLQ